MFIEEDRREKIVHVKINACVKKF